MEERACRARLIVEQHHYEVELAAIREEWGIDRHEHQMEINDLKETIEMLQEELRQIKARGLP